jgi:hypothetical protein
MGRLLAAAASAFAIVSASGAPAFAAGVESQWVYAPDAPDGPAAIFLDWTYSNVLLRIHCDKTAGELVFVAPDSTQYGLPHHMNLSVDDERPIEMKVKPLGANGEGGPTSTAHRALVGRLKLTRKLSASIAGASFVDVGAPNDMDEAWHQGRAAPLRRVAKTCPAN